MRDRTFRCVYPPKVYSTYSNVVYTEKKWNEKINNFLNDNYEAIKDIFLTYGLHFHYLPKEIKEVYYVKLGKTLSKDDEIFLSKEVNSEIGNYLDDGYVWLYDEPSLVCHNNQRFHKHSERDVWLTCLTFDERKDLWEQIKEMAFYFSISCPTEESVNSGQIVECKKLIPETEEQLTELFLKSMRDGGQKKDITDLWDRLERRFNRESSITIKKDYRIILDDFNGKELDLKDLPKTLYLFYLRHDEGISLDDLAKYMPELAYIYIKIRKDKRKARKSPLIVIENLVQKQYLNNFKSIRNKLQEVFDLERKSVYSIEHDDTDSHLFTINIPPKQRIWQCPEIEHLKVPTLPPPYDSTKVRRTWEILHELNDKKINDAISDEPPSLSDK
ncbi:hypothetical protein PRLR6025_29820 [Prevotella lacticifex]|uniref:hypothetical protein n=1 Tax=Prevotella lacticifex TaxID=2854755 RepID=UPI001CC4BED6|nr:hypothetical protein [Prevotella lacticifex]GJG69513.1 hypothetical protein PRLR6025_29820 [Prevotella lacticifex]